MIYLVLVVTILAALVAVVAVGDLFARLFTTATLTYWRVGTDVVVAAILATVAVWLFGIVAPVLFR